MSRRMPRHMNERASAAADPCALPARNYRVELDLWISSPIARAATPKRYQAPVDVADGFANEIARVGIVVEVVDVGRAAGEAANDTTHRAADGAVDRIGKTEGAR